MTNPYEFIGKIHTYGVNLVLENIHPKNQDLESDDFLAVIDFVSDFTASHIYVVPKYSKEFNRIFLDTTNIVNGTTPNLNELGEEVNNYFDRLLESPTGNPNEYIDHLGAHLSSAEVDLFNAKNLLPGKRPLYLICMSIAKSSLGILKKLKKRSRKAAKSIIVEDIKGAIQGFSNEQDLDIVISASITMSAIALLKDR